jgi:hypothetical protein
MAPSDANVFRYVLEGIRKYSTANDLQMLFKQHAGSSVKEKRNDYISIQSLPLNSKEQRLFSQVQRAGNFGKVLRDCNTDELKASLYHTLLVLYQLELIEFVPR